jgi:hypothetical protein
VFNRFAIYRDKELSIVFVPFFVTAPLHCRRGRRDQKFLIKGGSNNKLSSEALELGQSGADTEGLYYYSSKFIGELNVAKTLHRMVVVQGILHLDFHFYVLYFGIALEL